uniref:Uncharacterized protein n=1 Tax=Loa loa TaxID=7209 RepID=A0A1I7VHH9_LOALO
MIRDLVCQQNIMNDNKENIPPGNPDDIKAKMYLKKSKSFSPSDEMKKMMTYKKMSHHEMTIIPIRYLQINGDKAFCTGKFSHSRNISTTNYTNQDVGNLDDEEVVSTFGLQPIPYKPLSEMKRNEICALIGLLPRDNWMMESSIHWMSMYDQPDFLVVVPGNDNRLFQALAHYITGDDNDFHQIRQAIIQFELEHAAEFMNLKQWDRTTWDYHLNNLLSNVENGSDVELLAFSSMFKVDVWIFRRGRWFCYRPKFPVLKERCRNLSIQQYHIGANEGVYLNYENGLFLPVFKPSDNRLNPKGFYSMAFNDSGVTIQPSYRLISCASHLGQTIDSGKLGECITFIKFLHNFDYWTNSIVKKKEAQLERFFLQAITYAIFGVTNQKNGFFVTMNRSNKLTNCRSKRKVLLDTFISTSVGQAFSAFSGHIVILEK